MMIRIVFNTYDLKMALEAGKVKVSDCLISLHIEHANTSNDILSMYMHANKKNELISIDKKRLKSISISHNINSGDSSGTKLLVYIVDDKKHDTFIMVKDRHIGDTTDKAIVNIVGDELSKHKVKLSIVKDKFRNKKK